MQRRIWHLFGLAILVFVAQVQPGAAQDRPNGFSDAFFNDVALYGEMASLWNRAFDRCKAAGQTPAEDCVIHRDAMLIAHGRMTAPRCARVSDSIAKHYCIVIGSIAADLVGEFELDSVEGFIKAQDGNFEHAIDSAGTEVWSYLNHRCASSDASAGCILDDISHRLLPEARDIAYCKSIADTHGQADCLIAHWVASQVRAAAMAENAGVSGDFFYDRRVKPALDDLARRGQAACDRAGASAGPDCLVKSVAAAMSPYGAEMTPYCRDIGDSVDRYLCILTGALATDLYVKTGIGTADSFLKDHGKDGERTINEADALVAAFLARKCAETTEASRCGPKEVANRLDADPKAIAVCLSFTEDREAINCLLADRVMRVLHVAEEHL